MPARHAVMVDNGLNVYQTFICLLSGLRTVGLELNTRDWALRGKGYDSGHILGHIVRRRPAAPAACRRPARRQPFGPAPPELACPAGAVAAPGWGSAHACLRRRSPQLYGTHHQRTGGPAMKSNMWPDDTGLPAAGDWPDEGWAGGPAGGAPWPQAHAEPLAGLPHRAGAAERAEPRPVPHWGEPVPHWGEPAPIRSCWMCGIRMPADQMVADGGSACADLRYYCLDTWGCTERWTSRSARLVAIRPDAEETPKQRDGRGTGAGAAQPVPA